MVWPTLTTTNYIEWALVMQINLEANLMWDAVEGNASSVANDKAALAAILRAVPQKMVGTLTVKKTAKEAWDAVKIMRVGIDRVREASAQRLRKEFNAIELNADETLDKFNMRIMGIVNSLRTLGDTLQEVDIVRKILEVVPERYSQIACSIEMLLNLNVVSVEELIGRLRCSEMRRTTKTSHGGSALILTEAEWETRRRQREQGQGSSSSGAKDKKGKGTQQNRGRDGGRRDSSGERDMSKVKCYNCNKCNNHFYRDCPKP
jgi:hypothetical protein